MKYLFIIILLAVSINSFSQTLLAKDSITTVTPEIRNKILSESKDGGKIDFWTPIKGHEYDGKRLEQGSNLIVTNRDFALIKWSFVLTKNGISKTAIISIYEELKSRKIRADEVQIMDIGIKKASQ